MKYERKDLSRGPLSDNTTHQRKHMLMQHELCPDEGRLSNNNYEHYQGKGCLFYYVNMLAPL